MLPARANGETLVSATMCPRLPGPKITVLKLFQFKILNLIKNSSTLHKGNRDLDDVWTSQ